MSDILNCSNSRKGYLTLRRKYKDLQGLGKRLAQYRKKAGYSQRTLASEIGVSYRMIAYYESQEGRPPVDILVRLAEALDVSTDELLGVANADKKESKPKNRRLLRRFKQVEGLPSRDKETVMRMIEGLALKNSAQSKA